MRTNYSQVVEMTDKEKFNMYMKLSKKEIVRMHIELEKHIFQMPLTQVQSYPNNTGTYVDNNLWSLKHTPITSTTATNPFFITMTDTGI